MKRTLPSLMVTASVLSMVWLGCATTDQIGWHDAGTGNDGGGPGSPTRTTR
jgi:hypothetical protein